MTMAGTSPEVQITVACAYGDVGHRLRPTAMVRDWLIGMGYAKVLTVDPKPAVLTARASEKVAGVARAVKTAVKGSLNLR